MHDPESVWKSIPEREEPGMDVTMTTDELCAMARSRETHNVRTHWGTAALLIVFAAAFAYNVFSVTQPWIRLGQAWMLGVICFAFWTTVRQSPQRISANETCASFLQRALEGKRNALLQVRRFLFLLIPAIAASWWGGGPAVKARALGIDPSSPLFRFSSGPWPFLIVGVALAFIWFAFGDAAENAKREIEALRRRIHA